MARERCTRDSRYGDPPPPRQATSSRLRWLAVKTPNVRALATESNRLRKYPTAKSTPQWRDALSA